MELEVQENTTAVAVPTSCRTTKESGEDMTDIVMVDSDCESYVNVELNSEKNNEAGNDMLDITQGLCHIFYP